MCASGGGEAHILEKQTQTLLHPVLASVSDVLGVFRGSCQACFIKGGTDEPHDPVRALFPILTLNTYSIFCRLLSLPPHSVIVLSSRQLKVKTAPFLPLHVPLSCLHLRIRSSLNLEKSKLLPVLCVLIVHPYVLAHTYSPDVVGKLCSQWRITSSGRFLVSWASCQELRFSGAPPPPSLRRLFGKRAHTWDALGQGD